MITYRVAPKKFALDLSGEGARLAGGRWNKKGSPVIYTAEHPSLCLLEYLPSFDLLLSPPIPQLVSITIPDDLTILTLEEADLPLNWRFFPHNPSTAAIGQNWLNEGSASILKVPSVMTPYGYGWSLMLNPFHPELMGKMIATAVDWPIDGRLINKLK